MAEVNIVKHGPATETIYDILKWVKELQAELFRVQQEGGRSVTQEELDVLSRIQHELRWRYRDSYLPLSTGTTA